MPSDESEKRIRRRELDEVASISASKLSTETRQDIVEWVIRAGLGPLFLIQHPHQNFTNQEVGSLMSVTFDHEKDPIHYDVCAKIDEWRQKDDG